MTRRERLERKLEKRQEWAKSRKAKANAEYQKARNATDGIPFGQPILVGHHSEKRHRAAIARSDSAMGRVVENSNMAEHHESKAAGLASQLDNSIFSDDPDAVEALQAKVDRLEAERERIKAINKVIRKVVGKSFETALMTLEEFAAGNFIQPPITDDELHDLVVIRRVQAYYGPGYPPYKLQNLGGTIRTAQQRLAEAKARRERTAKVEATESGILIEGGPLATDYVRVTFAEKPDRSILNDLKAAGFRWYGGAWGGAKREAIPQSVLDLV